MKRWLVPSSPAVLDLGALDGLFLGITLPVPDLKGPFSKVMIGAFTNESIDGHKWRVGAACLTNFQYHLKLEGIPTQMRIWRHAKALPACREMIASYRAAVLATESSACTSPPRKSRPVPSHVA